MQRELGTKRANGCHRKVQLVRGFLESEEKEDEDENERIGGRIRIRVGP